MYENNDTTDNNNDANIYKDLDTDEKLISAISEIYNIQIDEVTNFYNTAIITLKNETKEQPFVKFLQDKFNLNNEDANNIMDSIALQARRKKDYFHKEIYRNANGKITKEIIYNSEYNPKEHIIDKGISKHFIDARQPGVGKTERIVNIINKSEGRNIIFGSSHDFLEDVKERINKQFIQLKGFTLGCAKYDAQTNEGKIIRDMYKKEIPNKIICMCMNCKGRCHYREQFKDTDEEKIVIGAPIEFLHLFELDEFENVFIEERVRRHFTISWNFKKIKAELIKLKPYFDEYILKQKAKKEKNINPKLWELIVEAFKTKNLEYIQYYSYLLQNAIESTNTKRIAEFIKYKENGGKIQLDKLFYKSICMLRISNLMMYLEFEQRDRDRMDEEFTTMRINYQEFLFYKQMKSHRMDLQYNCASFVDFEFLYDLQHFEELFPEYTGYVEVEYSHFTNPENFKIIKMTDQGFYKSTIKQNLKEHKQQIKNLIYYQKSKNKKVCILTFKNWVKNDKCMGCDAFWFGGKHGTNTFRNYDILIVLGTYLPNQKAYEEYMEIHHPDEDYSLKFTKKKGEMLPNDEKLLEYYEKIFMKDVYDSVHRLRPLWRQEEIKVYWFGNNIPDDLKAESDYSEKK